MTQSTYIMKSYFDVRVFMEAMRQTVRTEAELEIPERAFRAKLILDEINELKEDGYDDKSMIEIFDALADIVYVSWGALLSHGLVNVNTALELHSIYADRQFDTSLAKNFIEVEDTERWIREKQERTAPLDVLFRDYLASTTLAELRNNILAIIIECHRIAEHYGFDLNLVLDEVHESNMTKLLGDEGVTLYVTEGDLKGKVRKGKLFRDADIAKVIYA